MLLGISRVSQDTHHTKKCFKCGEVKHVFNFSKHSTGKYGVATTCKPCKSVYRKEYYIKNKDKETIKSAEWSSNNLHKKREYRAKRRATILKATPIWSNSQAIKRIYSEADFLSKATGIKYEVDHIIPLQGGNVCGLHVPNNLQVIKMADNRKKSARYES
jgi:hypothetical protein